MIGCREMDYECDCACHHEDVEINHCMTCCYECPHCHMNISTFFHDEHKKYCKTSGTLNVELEYFDQNREEWFKHHAGKFALIKGAVARGFYDTAENAFKVGVSLFGIVPFLIKKVLLEDEYETI